MARARVIPYTIFDGKGSGDQRCPLTGAAGESTTFQSGSMRGVNSGCTSPSKPINSKSPHALSTGTISPSPSVRMSALSGSGMTVCEHVTGTYSEPIQHKMTDRPVVWIWIRQTALDRADRESRPRLLRSHSRKHPRSHFCVRPSVRYMFHYVTVLCQCAHVFH